MSPEIVFLTGAIVGLVLGGIAFAGRPGPQLSADELLALYEAGR